MSTSIFCPVTSAPGRTEDQVLVQGNAAKLIAKVLQGMYIIVYTYHTVLAYFQYYSDEYGLPLKFIEAIDRIKPPKRKSGQK